MNLDSEEMSNLASTNETEGKKKKKRRKNKKKKKKKEGEEETAGALIPDSNEICVKQEDESIVEDPEFEEDLKQFQMRLMQCCNAS